MCDGPGRQASTKDGGVSLPLQPVRASAAANRLDDDAYVVLDASGPWVSAKA